MCSSWENLRLEAEAVVDGEAEGDQIDSAHFGGDWNWQGPGDRRLLGGTRDEVSEEGGKALRIAHRVNDAGTPLIRSCHPFLDR